jgi:hypothetical protein
MPNSNPRSIQVGSVDNTLIATVYNTDGSVKADLAHNATGISIFIQRIGEANGSALTLSAKATPQTAHADGAFLNLGGGDISVDVPDAPFATYKGRARIYGTFTGGTIIGEWFDVVGFDAAAVAVGAPTVDDIVAASGSKASTPPLERNSNDTNPVTFQWLSDDATITGQRSLNNAAYEGVSGAISFLRTEGSKHLYTLAYNAADRPAANGIVRYAFTDGTYTRYLSLRVSGSNVVVPPTVAQLEARTLLAASYFTGGAVLSVTNPVTVGTNNDKNGYALTQNFPSNFESLGINPSGHVSRVVLVDTTTTNSDMVSPPLDATQTQAAAAAAITASITAEEMAAYAKQIEILAAVQAGELGQDVRSV